MKETRIIMGMPVTVEVADAGARQEHIDEVFAYFRYVDEKFSTYKETSEITAINRGLLQETDYSDDMRAVFELSQRTKEETAGYFDIAVPGGTLDPSGIVKGWAIFNAATILKSHGLEDFYIDAGGDIQTSGNNAHGRPWRVGIRNPFNENEIVKTVRISDEGIATSGTYIRGRHIYDPHAQKSAGGEVVSLTVIGPDIYEADRFATAAFAMGLPGIRFIENLNGFEGYMIATDGIATMTSGFSRYAAEHV